ncbi:unnamed protein product [Protopolystoma xenopodis]|uniref:Uncharacterized protein n=1 Tax=Protopolystoma xenopodis TaxID=117903 RepID=A0A448X3N7_9PLAT|nr:unnamed protein product [Protopolystoma xenopodis]
MAQFYLGPVMLPYDNMFSGELCSYPECQTLVRLTKVEVNLGPVRLLDRRRQSFWPLRPQSHSLAANQPLFQAAPWRPGTLRPRDLFTFLWYPVLCLPVSPSQHFAQKVACFSASSNTSRPSCLQSPKPADQSCPPSQQHGQECSCRSQDVSNCHVFSQAFHFFQSV